MGEEAAGVRLKLFDLSEDVGAERDLAESLPEKVRELDSLMVGFLDEVDGETRKLGSKKEVYENARPE